MKTGAIQLINISPHADASGKLLLRDLLSIVEAANGDEAVTIDDLMQQIQETERLIDVYRNADEVIVGTQDEIYSRRGLINRTTLTADEIGDQIVRILRLTKGSSQIPTR